MKGTYPAGGSLQAILEAIPSKELHRRQAAMAAVAPRMLLALEDGGRYMGDIGRYRGDVARMLRAFEDGGCYISPISPLYLLALEDGGR